MSLSTFITRSWRRLARAVQRVTTLAERVLDACMRFLCPMKRSAIAFLVSGALGFFSMGFLGIGLLYAVQPVLNLWFLHGEQWHGDWVWPALIAAGVFWSLGFLMAGALNLRLQARGWGITARRVVYVAVLWLWALCLWAYAFMVNVPGR
jgi:hypothetical protein